ncbi:hypothetical protein TWF281_007739 [Arthrobotrys megalospora]
MPSDCLAENWTWILVSGILIGTLFGIISGGGLYWMKARSRRNENRKLKDLEEGIEMKPLQSRTVCSCGGKSVERLIRPAKPPPPPPPSLPPRRPQPPSPVDSVRLSSTASSWSHMLCTPEHNTPVLQPPSALGGLNAGLTESPEPIELGTAPSPTIEGRNPIPPRKLEDVPFIPPPPAQIPDLCPPETWRCETQNFNSMGFQGEVDENRDSLHELPQLGERRSICIAPDSPLSTIGRFVRANPPPADRISSINRGFSLHIQTDYDDFAHMEGYPKYP